MLAVHMMLLFGNIAKFLVMGQFYSPSGYMATVHMMFQCDNGAKFLVTYVQGVGTCGGASECIFFGKMCLGRP